MAPVMRWFINAMPTASLTVGMVVFGLCAHRPELWAPRALGLLLAGLGIATAVARAPAPAGLLGIKPIPAGRGVYLLLCVVLGVGLSMLYRYEQDRPIFAAQLTPFCVLAAAIGLCEELVYRGLIQSMLRPRGVVLACLGAAVAHTAYKCSLFVLPGIPQHANLPVLAAGTLAVGFLFGLMREAWGGVWFPALAHMAFDVASYGDLPSAPWWVW
jgi:membrane protease YdiL (CAAX protease family)